MHIIKHYLCISCYVVQYEQKGFRIKASLQIARHLFRIILNYESDYFLETMFSSGNYLNFQCREGLSPARKACPALAGGQVRHRQENSARQGRTG